MKDHIFAPGGRPIKAERPRGRPERRRVIGKRRHKITIFPTSF